MGRLDELPSSGVSSEISWTAKVERKLVRKIDVALLPMLWIMNLLSWMDRAKYFRLARLGRDVWC